MPDTTITLAHRLRRSDDVLFQNLDGEAVLLDLSSEAYFGLNDVGTRVWELLESTPLLSDVSARLQLEYEVDQVRAEADLLGLAARLVESGLASVV